MTEESKNSRMLNEEAIGVKLTNEIGQENSYVNVVIHLLHHMPEIFEFLNINKEYLVNNEKYSILYELYILLKEYEEFIENKNKKTTKNIEEKILNVDVFREKLNILYNKEGYFPLNKAEDPAELVFLILHSIHAFSEKLESPKHNINAIKRRIKCKSNCIIHRNFLIDIIQQCECLKCNSKGQMYKFSNSCFVYDLDFNKIRKKFKQISLDDNYYQTYSKLFKIYKDIREETDMLCPNNCEKNPNDKEIEVEKGIFMKTELDTVKPIVVNKVYMVKPSKYLMFNLNYKATNPKLTDIFKLLLSIPFNFCNEELFEINDKIYSKNYSLFGMFCYWNNRFACFFKNERREWIYYEDLLVKKMKTLNDIIITCIQNHFIPLMLFYSEIDSKFISNENKYNENTINNIINFCRYMDDEIDNKENNYIIENDNNDNDNYTYYNNNAFRLGNKQEKVRPNMEPLIVKDPETERSFNEIHKQYENKKQRKTKISISENTKIDINDNDNSIYNIFKNQSLEDFDLVESKWKCENCEYINNYLMYECKKCKEINLNIYTFIIELKKKNNTKNKFINEDKRFETLSKNFEYKYSSYFNNLKKNRDNEDHKCNDENEKFNNEKNNMNSTSKSEIKTIRDKYMWICPFCSNVNDDKYKNFCEKCKKNKPKTNDFSMLKILDYIEDINNSIKQY